MRLAIWVRTRLPRGSTAIALLTCLLVMGCEVGKDKAPSLPNLAANTKSVTLSGVSAGAFMAAQIQFAHADMVSGVGLVAGGLYGCVESVDNPLLHMPSAKAVQAIQVCMLANYRAYGLPNARSLARLARRFAAMGAIDPISALADDRIYLFTGSNDRSVSTAILDAAADL